MLHLVLDLRAQIQRIKTISFPKKLATASAALVTKSQNKLNNALKGSQDKQ